MRYIPPVPFEGKMSHPESMGNCIRKLLGFGIVSVDKLVTEKPVSQHSWRLKISPSGGGIKGGGLLLQEIRPLLSGSCVPMKFVNRYWVTMPARLPVRPRHPGGNEFIRAGIVIRQRCS